MSFKIVIPDSELEFSFSRAQGPGGQNVNKVSTRVTLHWDFWQSRVLSQAQKAVLVRDARFLRKVTQAGLVVLHEQSTRSQEQNKNLVQDKLIQLVSQALTPKVKRVPTRVPRRVKAQRLDNKRRKSIQKRGRSRRALED